MRRLLGVPRGLLRRLSLRGRLTLIAAFAVALTVAGVSASAYLIVRHQLRGQVDASLVQQAQQIQGQVRRSGELDPRGLFTAPANGYRPQVLVAAAEYVDAEGGSYPVLQGYSLPTLVDPRLVHGVAAGDSTQLLRDTTLSDGTHVRVIAVSGFASRETGKSYALVLARSLSETDTTLSRLALLLLGVGGLGVLAAAGGGLLVARAALRPVDRLTAAAEQVARTEELDVPIEVSGDDEVARLGRSFNAMTAALSTSRVRQRQLVADAGHELRTPLTSLRTNIDLLVRSERSGRALPAEDRARLLDDVGAQLLELGTLVGELVDLARDERTSEPRVRLDLAEVAGRALERARPRAGDAVALTAELEPWPVVGQPAALERAVLNLVDNAVKFSPTGGTVAVGLSQGLLTVADEGPGVPAEDLPHVFERFYRATSSRGLPGSGLGLAIVAQTIRAHAGDVRLTPRPGGGTLAQLWLPAADALTG